MAAFDAPTLAELQDRIAGDLTTRLRAAGYASDARIRGTLPWVLAWTWAFATWSLHRSIAYLSRQLFVSTASEAWLYVHAAIWGVPRGTEKIAAGPVTFAGGVGADVPSGTQAQDAEGTVWVTTEDAVVGVGGTVDVNVSAAAAGLAGNAVAGVALTLVSSVPGIDAEAVVASGGITGGDDVEDVESWRGRLLLRIQKRPQGGAEADYEQWSLEASTLIGRALVSEHYPLPGDVTVWLLSKLPADPLPDSGTIATVQSAIDAIRPVTATAYALAPATDVIDMTIAAVPDTTAVRAAIDAELRDLFLRSAQPDAATTIANSNIRAAISAAEGETSHTLSSVDGDGTGTTSPSTAIGTIAVLGTITWS